MKRHNNLYDKICDIKNIRLAYNRARQGKNWQRAIKAFMIDTEGNLLKIQKILLNRAFKPSPYTVKQIYVPKTRDIYIVPFNPDRVIHHALMNVLEPIYSKLFIFDSYACIIGKGIHRGSKRTMEFVRKDKYCLKCDIAKFYPSMDHDILFTIIQRKIKCKDTLRLIHDIIYSIDGGKNVPIGNYTSQWFGNLYLHEIDMYAKHVLKMKHYVRYCDDFLFFHNDKAYLKKCAVLIRKFAAEKLALRLSKCALFPVSQGVDFLGYRHFPNYVLLRKSTATRVKRRLKLLPILFKKGRITLEQFRSSIASSFGWMKWANTYNLGLKLQIGKLMEMVNGLKAA